MTKWLGLSFLTLAACTPAAAPTDASTGRDVGEVPTSSCAQPGDEGNEVGLGRFCTRGGGECRVNPTSGARLCIIDLAPDQDQWLCTLICATDDQCGTGGVCRCGDGGCACFPAECLPEPTDAGIDDGGGGPDAGAADDASVTVDAATAGDAS